MARSNSKSNRPVWEQKAADLFACLKSRDTQFDKFASASEKAQLASHELDDVQQDSAWNYLQMTPLERHSFEAILAVFPSEKALNILKHQIASQKPQQQIAEKPVRAPRQETTNA